MMGNVVSKMGEMVRAWGMLYNSVLQSVLLYGSESWVVTGTILKVLEGFHHQVARKIIDMTERWTTRGEC